MNRQDIIDMAREVGFEIHERKQQARVGMDSLLGIDSTDKIEKFAVIVAAKEREECARFIEDYKQWIGLNAKTEIAKALRELEK